MNKVSDQPRSDILRYRRVKTDSFAPKALTAIIKHASSSLNAALDNISLYGARLNVTTDDTVSVDFRTGQKLSNLKLLYQNTSIYEGAAVVRYSDVHENKITIGVEVSGGQVDLATLYRLSDRYNFAERWDKVSQPCDMSLFPQSIVYQVLETSSYLGQCRDFFNKEEQAICHQDLPTREQTEKSYIEQAWPSFIKEMNKFTQAMDAAYNELDASSHSLFRTFCQQHMLDFFLSSPAMSRAYSKPLGYAGDYEMMNNFYRNHNFGESIFSKLCNLYSMNLEASQAIVNRVHYMKERILALFGSLPNGRRVRVLSVGSGPAEEINLLLQENPSIGERLEVMLLDQDEHAIRYCERYLCPLMEKEKVRFRIIKESIGRVLVKKHLPERLGEIDLIYSAGLFDYLNDKTFVSFAQVLYDSVAPGGELVIGNFNCENSSRGVMEFLLEWYLNHRSSEELSMMGQKLSPLPKKIEIQHESTNVNLFLSIVK